jgi:hypothetical protein
MHCRIVFSVNSYHLSRARVARLHCQTVKSTPDQAPSKRVHRKVWYDTMTCAHFCHPSTHRFTFNALLPALMVVVLPKATAQARPPQCSLAWHGNSARLTPPQWGTAPSAARLPLPNNRTGLAATLSNPVVIRMFAQSAARRFNDDRASDDALCWPD